MEGESKQVEEVSNDELVLIWTCGQVEFSISIVFGSNSRNSGFDTERCSDQTRITMAWAK